MADVFDTGLSDEEIEKRKQESLARLEQLIVEEEGRTGFRSSLRDVAAELTTGERPEPLDEAVFGRYPSSGRRGPAPEHEPQTGSLSNLTNIDIGLGQPDISSDVVKQLPRAMSWYAKAPWMGATALAGLPYGANKLLGYDADPTAFNEGLKKIGDVDKALDQIFGIPTTPAQKVVAKVAESTYPGSLGATAAYAGTDALINGIEPYRPKEGELPRLFRGANLNWLTESPKGVEDPTPPTEYPTGYVPSAYEGDRYPSSGRRSTARTPDLTTDLLPGYTNQAAAGLVEGVATAPTSLGALITGFAGGSMLGRDPEYAIEKTGIDPLAPASAMLRANEAVGRYVGEGFPEPGTMGQKLTRMGIGSISPTPFGLTVPMTAAVFGYKAATEGISPTPITQISTLPPPEERLPWETVSPAPGPFDWMRNLGAAYEKMSFVTPAEAQAPKSPAQRERERLNNMLQGLGGGTPAQAPAAPGPSAPIPKEATPTLEGVLYKSELISEAMRVAKILGESRLTNTENKAVESVRAGEQLKPAHVRILQGIIDKSKRNELRVSVNAAGGPTNVAATDFNTLSTMAVVTAGMVFAPWVYKSFATTVLPRLSSGLKAPRQVADAPEGTMAFSTWMDPIRAAVDPNASIFKNLIRAGVPKNLVEASEQGWLTQTGSAGQSFSDAAIVFGEARTPNVIFKAPKSLEQMSVEHQHPWSQQYLILKHTFDELNIAATPAINAIYGTKIREPGLAGRTDVRGQTVRDVAAEMHAIEQSQHGPAAIKASQDWQGWLNAMRKFELDTGQISREKYNYLTQSRPNFVPYEGGTAIEIGLPGQKWNGTFGDVYKSMSDYTSRRFRRSLDDPEIMIVIDLMNHKNAFNVKPFTEVTKTQMDANPSWANKSITVMDNGVKRTFVGDPHMIAMLHTDPHFFSAFNPLFISKRIFETFTTGPGNPGFAFATHWWRNWLIGNQAIPEGRAGVGPIANLIAPVQQTAPQLAKFIGRSIDTVNDGWIKKTLGQGYATGLADKWARTFHSFYDNSTYANMQLYGTYKNPMMSLGGKETGAVGSVMKMLPNPIEKARENVRNLSLAQVQQALNDPAWTARNPAAIVGRGYLNLLSSAFNAESYAYARRNLKIAEKKGPVSEAEKRQILLEARGLTGDNIYQGKFWWTDRTGKERLIGFEDASSPIRDAAGKLAFGVVGGLSELARMTSPWNNAIIQGTRRLGKAYADDPLKFTARMWMYHGLPAAGLEIYTHALGTDPNGQSYQEYKHERRSDYRKSMYWYFPRYGLPAEVGYEFPRFQELSIISRLTEQALDHMLRPNGHISEKESLMRAAGSFAGIVLNPAMIPLVNVGLGLRGDTASSGIYFENVYRRNADPHNPQKGFSTNAELAARAQFAAAADFVLNMVEAFRDVPANQPAGRGAAVREAGTGVFTRNLPFNPFDSKAPTVGNSILSEKMFEDKKAVDNMIDYQQAWERYEKIGGSLTKLMHGPTNPDYREFIDRITDKFKTTFGRGSQEAVDYRESWKEHRLISEQLAGMRGTSVAWGYKIDSPLKEQLRNDLTREGIDPYNYAAVKQHLERKRQNTLGHISQLLSTVEREMSQAKKRPIRFQDLKPHSREMAPGDILGSEIPDDERPW